MQKCLISLALILIGCGSIKNSYQFYQSPDLSVQDSINNADNLEIANWKNWDRSMYLTGGKDSTILIVYRYHTITPYKSYIFSITTKNDSIIQSNIRIETYKKKK